MSNHLELVETMSPAVSPADVAALVDVTEPIEVRLDEVHAGPVRFSGTEMKIRLERGEPGFALSEDGQILMVRLEHAMFCESSEDESDEDDPEPTEIRASHIVSFRISGKISTSPNIVSAWIETNVYFMAYPYVRQFFTEITSSLGLPPVVLSYMKREDWPYARRDLEATEL